MVPGRTLKIDCSVDRRQSLGTGRRGTWASSGRLGRISVTYLARPWSGGPSWVERLEVEMEMEGPVVGGKQGSS